MVHDDDDDYVNDLDGLSDEPNEEVEVCYELVQRKSCGMSYLIVKCYYNIIV